MSDKIMIINDGKHLILEEKHETLKAENCEKKIRRKRCAEPMDRKGGGGHSCSKQQLFCYGLYTASFLQHNLQRINKLQLNVYKPFFSLKNRFLKNFLINFSYGTTKNASPRWNKAKR